MFFVSHSPRIMPKNTFFSNAGESIQVADRTLVQQWVEAHRAAVRGVPLGGEQGLYRVVPHETTAAATASTVDDTTTVPVPSLPAVAIFCLHRDTVASVAGAVCRECGIVLADTNCPSERGHPAPIVVHSNEEAGPNPVTEAARHEWALQTADKPIGDLPAEVRCEAQQIFERVFTQQGAVVGPKARALVRVTLLYCSRRLYGADRANEERLIQCFPTVGGLFDRSSLR